MLVELLRAASREDEALEQLAKIAGDLEARGRRRRRPAAARASSAPRRAGDAAATAAGGPPATARRPGLPRHRLRRRRRAAPPPARAPAESAPADLPLDRRGAAAGGLEPTQPAATPGRGRRADIDPLGTIELDARTTRSPVEPRPRAGDPRRTSTSTSVGRRAGARARGPGRRTRARRTRRLESLDAARRRRGRLEPLDGLIDVGRRPGPSSSPRRDLAGELDDRTSTWISRGRSAAAEPTAGLPLIEPRPPAEPTLQLVELEERIARRSRRIPTSTASWPIGCSCGGDLARAAEELRLALAGYEAAEDWPGVGDRRPAGRARARQRSGTTRSGSSSRSGPASGAAAGGVPGAGRRAGRAGATGQGDRGLRPGARARSRPTAAPRPAIAAPDRAA